MDYDTDKPDKQLHVVDARSLEHILLVKKNKTSAPITLKSKRTGKDYTFKISRSKYKGTWYTHVKIERGGHLAFTHLGFYSKDEMAIIKNGSPVESKAARGIAWVLNCVMYDQWEKLEEQVEIIHCGYCMACGKKLTDADSIERGVGPVCAGLQ
jgi:hypothetical protein